MVELQRYSVEVVLAQVQFRQPRKLFRKDLTTRTRCELLHGGPVKTGAPKAFSMTRSLNPSIFPTMHFMFTLSCISLSTFPAHASMHFTLLSLRMPLCSPCACLSAFNCLLSLRMRLCTSLRTACLYAFHCLLSLRVCISLSTFPAHASMHFTVYFPCACIFTLYLCVPRCYFPCACLCAFHCLVSLRTPLFISLPRFPAHASTHLTLYLPHACRYAFHCLLSLRVPLCNFTVYFPCACLYAFHCLLSLRMPLCISLCALRKHPSTHFTLYLPYAGLYAFHCALSPRMPLCFSLSTFRLCSRSCGDVLCALLLYSKVATSQPELQHVLRARLLYSKVAALQPDPCRQSRADREHMRRFTRGKRNKTSSFCTTTTPTPAEGLTQNSPKTPQSLHIDHADPIARQFKNRKKRGFARRPRRLRRGSRASRKHHQKSQKKHPEFLHFCTLTTPIPTPGHAKITKQTSVFAHHADP